MRAVSFSLTDNGHNVQKWTMFDKGKKAGEVTFKHTRVALNRRAQRELVGWVKSN